MTQKNGLVFLWIGLFFCFLFRPRHAFSVGGLQDDLCYINFIYKFLGLIPEQTCYLPKTYFPGVSVAWLPAALVALVIHFIFKQPFTPLYVILIGITSFLLWLFSYLLFSKALTKRIQTSPTQNFLFFLNFPVLYFCFQRTTLAHAAELFFACATFYALVYDRLYLSIVTGTLLALTRPNDAPIFLVIGGAFLDHKKIIWTKPKKIFIASVLFFACIPFIYIGFFKGYGKTTFLLNVFKDITLTEVFRMLFNRYTGFLWAGLSWTLVFIVSLLHLRKMSYLNWGVLIWLALQFLVATGWTTAGGTLYNRYFIGTYIGVFLLYSELHFLLSESEKKFFKFLFYANGIYLTYLYWLGTSRFAPFWAPIFDSNLWGFTILKHQLYSLSLAAEGSLGMGILSSLPNTAWLPRPIPLLNLQQTCGLAILTLALYGLWKRSLVGTKRN